MSTVDLTVDDLLAIHEAGHAVAAEAFGYCVVEVAVGANAGHCKYQVPAEDSHPAPGTANMERRLAVKVAGTVAEALFLGRSATDVSTWAADLVVSLGQDGTQARALLGVSPSARAVPELDEAICWAAEILAERWQKVIACARSAALVPTPVHTRRAEKRD